MQFIRQNDTGKIGIGPFVDKDDGLTMEESITLSGADSAAARLGDDSVVDISGYTWAAITGMDGMYDLTMQTGMTDTVGPMLIVVEDVSICLPVKNEFMVVEEAVYDALYASGAAGFLATATLTIAEQSQGAPPAAPTAEEILSYFYMGYVRNKVIIDTDALNQKIIYADDGTTKVYTKALSDASSVTTVAEAITGT